jgi:hypothetical protein
VEVRVLSSAPNLSFLLLLSLDLSKERSRKSSSQRSADGGGVSHISLWFFLFFEKRKNTAAPALRMDPGLRRDDRLAVVCSKKEVENHRRGEAPTPTV